MKIKKFFSTPKRTVFTISVIIFSLALIGVISVFTVYAIVENNSIGKNTAIDTAYAAAGITSEQVDAVNAKLKFDDGKFVYDVEFYSGGKEYEYKIKSSDGSIIEFENPDSYSSSTPVITVDKAKEIALSHSGINAESATFTKVKLDKDDGIEVYEIEFYTSDKEYEYEISAHNGAVKSAKVDSLLSLRSDDNSSTDEIKNIITLDEARNIAVSDANVALENTTFTKSKFTEGDKNNLSVYEFQFINEGKEYKYKIEATTGEILTLKEEETANADEFIGPEAAKTAALSHAGLSVENIAWSKSELDEDDNIFYYEVFFQSSESSGFYSYEYKINALDGSVIKSKKKEATSVYENLITEEEALTVAMDHANLKDSDIIKVEIEFDEDDFYYDVEFQHLIQNKNSFECTEYEYKIHASSKEIINFKKEKDNISFDTTLYEAVEVAKQTALNKIAEFNGLDSITSNFNITKAKLESKNSLVTYDVEIIYNGIEYEFTIDETGKEIIGWEIDD